MSERFGIQIPGSVGFNKALSIRFQPLGAFLMITIREDSSNHCEKMVWCIPP